MRLKADGHYELTVRDHIKWLSGWAALWMGIGWIFYDSFWILVIAVPLYPVALRWLKKEQLKKKEKEIRAEFKDVMITIYSSLAAGATLEEGVRRAGREMMKYPEKHPRMVVELALVESKLERNIPLRKALEDLAGRCGEESIQQFVQVVIIASRQGGNLSEIVRDNIGKIQRRNEISFEIEGLIGAKRNEFKIMSVMPAGIMIYMRIFSPEFMAILYAGLFQRIVMTGCLGFYFGTIALGIYILNKNQCL